MADPKGAFIWYELLTTDAAAAAAFYGDVVGWQVSDSGMPGMDYRILNAGEQSVGGLMALDENMLAGGARPAWLGYIAVDDVDRAVGELTEDGAAVHVPPTDIPDVGRFAMLNDPQGIVFYVMHATNNEPSHAFRQGAAGHCAWNELATPDPEAALGFYTRHFGWQRGETMPIGELGDYQMLDLGETTIGAVMQAAGAPPMWRFYFRVPDLAAALERIQAAGGQLLHGPQPVPGDDEILIAADPQGAMFALVAKSGGTGA